MNSMFSTKTGIVALAMPLPTRTESTIFGLTLSAFCFSVISVSSFGVNAMPHSMRATSSAVRGSVFTFVIRGAFVPSVNVLRRRLSRNDGQFVLRIWSTEAIIVCESTGSYISQKRSRKLFIQSADSNSVSSRVLTSSR